MGQVTPFKDGGEHASLVNVASYNAPFYYRKAFQVKMQQVQRQQQSFV